MKAPNMSDMALTFVTLMLPACEATFAPACSPDQLVAIDRAYEAEMVQYCRGAFYQCPERGRIEAKYAAQREAWVRCDPVDGPGMATGSGKTEGDPR